MLIRTFSALLALAAISLPAHASDDDVWAPARDGKMLCSNPDAGNKTCDSLSEITLDGRGGMTYTDHWFQPEVAEGVVVSVTAKATLKNGRSCMVYDYALLDRLRFEKDGQPVPETEAGGYRVQIKAILADFVGRELCIRLSPYGASYSAQMSLDGFELAAATRWTKWVSKEDGYRLVAP